LVRGHMLGGKEKKLLVRKEEEDDLSFHGVIGKDLLLL